MAESAATWKHTLTEWMNAQNSQTEYFFVTHESTEGSARYWLFYIERQTWNNDARAWDPRRKCLVVSIRPQASTMAWLDFSERAAQDASNIARHTPNVSYFVGDLTHFHGYKVVIEPGQLTLEQLIGYQNVPSGANVGQYLKTLASHNDEYMKTCGD
ncbi:hypothetical protein A1F96_04883 [Pyrenophora tritici-repentis]|nr:hypothetical protein A1F96_04883 [Pyrenophora tritici-repentis]